MELQVLKKQCNKNLFERLYSIESKKCILFARNIYYDSSKNSIPEYLQVVFATFSLES